MTGKLYIFSLKSFVLILFKQKMLKFEKSDYKAMDHALDFIRRFEEIVSDSDGNDIGQEDVDWEITQTLGAKLFYVFVQQFRHFFVHRISDVI